MTRTDIASVFAGRRIFAVSAETELIFFKDRVVLSNFRDL